MDRVSDLAAWLFGEMYGTALFLPKSFCSQSSKTEVEPIKKGAELRRCSCFFARGILLPYPQCFDPLKYWMKVYFCAVVYCWEYVNWWLKGTGIHWPNLCDSSQNSFEEVRYFHHLNSPKSHSKALTFCWRHPSFPRRSVNYHCYDETMHRTCNFKIMLAWFCTKVCNLQRHLKALLCAQMVECKRFFQR